MTVADLKAKGAIQLGDAQLKALIVGKAFWVRNNVTGEQFSITYTAEGQSNSGMSAGTPQPRAALATHPRRLPGNHHPVQD